MSAETSNSRPPPRSKEFDDITMGWSLDSAENIEARIQLAEEICAKNPDGKPTFAEAKVLAAMRKRFAED